MNICRAFLVVLPCVVGVVSCQSFEGARDDARALRAEVAPCAAGDECVAVSVLNDCTGVLGCPFPVRADRKAYAQERAEEIAESSRNASTCAITSCAGDQRAVCNAEQGRCVMVGTAGPRTTNDDGGSDAGAD